ncbi:hypothetical protein CRUP_000683 [Coryphaenoides rupestris]|nr:hypothetical protein CRUP_000683 [Coryphaenoides rupestris]
MDTSSDEEEGRTFVQVVCEKYNPENFPYCRGQGMGVVVLPSPPGSPVKDRLNLPSVLVLNNCGITKAGDRTEVATFCAHVVELDLSYNQLRDWEEIGTIVSNIPHLDFLNLSKNPLSGVELEPSLAEVFSRVRQLVLINTHVTWDTVHTLTSHTPELEELFLCLNLYEEVVESGTPCPSLRLLQITDNQLRAWAEVRKLGAMYPRLEMLVLANNGLDSVEDGPETLERLFPNLRSINLNNSGLSRWEDIECLNFFPKLEEVKTMGIPLLQPYTDQQRRSLIVAQMQGRAWPGVGAPPTGCRCAAVVVVVEVVVVVVVGGVGGGEVGVGGRYHVLVSKYGELAPLAEVDLTPRGPTVEVRCGDRVQVLDLRPEQTVGELKKHLRALVQLPPGGMRLFHIGRECCSASTTQEMKYRCRALHSYAIRDGDEILVVPKVKARCHSSDA